MFYLSDGRVKLTDSQADVCGAGEIESAISALMALQGDPATPKEIDEDRYTLEGIDRQFKADPGFVPSKDVWREDSAVDWRGIPGTVLFQRYQRHAETYCWGCMDYNQDPTYEGFRQWLIQLRDMAGEED